jgi:hypothetical protein
MDGILVMGSPSRFKSITTGVLIAWLCDGLASPAGGPLHRHCTDGLSASIEIVRRHIGFVWCSSGTPYDTHAPPAQ